MSNNKNEFILKLEKYLKERKAELAQLQATYDKTESKEKKIEVLIYAAIAAITILLPILITTRIEVIICLFCLIPASIIPLLPIIPSVLDDIMLSKYRSEIRKVENEVEELEDIPEKLLQYDEDRIKSIKEVLTNHELLNEANNLHYTGFDRYLKSTTTTRTAKTMQPTNNQPTVFTNIKPISETKDYSEDESAKANNQDKVRELIKEPNKDNK